MRISIVENDKGIVVNAMWKYTHTLARTYNLHDQCSVCSKLTVCLFPLFLKVTSKAGLSCGHTGNSP